MGARALLSTAAALAAASVAEAATAAVSGGAAAVGEQQPPQGGGGGGGAASGGRPQWLWAWTLYLTLAAIAFLPRIPLRQREGDPIFIYAAPFCVWKWRIRALLDFKESLSPGTRALLFFRWWLLLFDQVFWHVLWTLDDLLFPSYRDVDLKGSVFIVGGFRTGSTSLHRTLALDEQRFISPRMLEIVYPFLVVHLVLDVMEWCDKNIGTQFIYCVDELYKRVCGPELLARHPMSFYEAEEEDLLFAINYGVGWYSAIQFPSASVWMNVGQISKFSRQDKQHLFAYYQRVMQKVLWRRGKGRTLLSKSHLIEFVETLDANIPEAKFVDIVRHPKDSFVSWLALQQAGSRNFTRFQFPQEEAVQLHLRFWDHFFAKEMELFNGASTDRKRFTQLSFKEYCLGPEKVVKQLYALWGLPLTLELQRALSESKKEHEAYKQVHKYRNPTLEELGLSLEVVERRYDTYITTVHVGVSHNPKDKHPPPILPASLTRGVSLLSSISSPPSTSPVAGMSSSSIDATNGSSSSSNGGGGAPLTAEGSLGGSSLQERLKGLEEEKGGSSSTSPVASSSSSDDSSGSDGSGSGSGSLHKSPRIVEQLPYNGSEEKKV